MAPLVHLGDARLDVLKKFNSKTLIKTSRVSPGSLNMSVSERIDQRDVLSSRRNDGSNFQNAENIVKLFQDTVRGEQPTSLTQKFAGRAQSSQTEHISDMDEWSKVIYDVVIN